MIKNIIFDFDGVILDSVKIKAEGYRELFMEFGEEKSSQLVEYHYKNGGISRFEKIHYFYREILKEKIFDEDVMKLAEKFGDIVYKNLGKKENIIEDTFQFLKKKHNKFNLHIASGAEDMELKRICYNLELDKFFLSIHGSPTPKHILVEEILKKSRYLKKETILIGDSHSDFEAATKNGIRFFGYNNVELMRLGNYIESFHDIRFEKIED
jgi:phosphoglycolate phosphatase-like HAD superfamily hydrolase